MQAGDQVLLFSTDGDNERLVMCGQVAPLVLLTPIFPFRLLGSMQLLTLALVRMSATLLLFSDCSLQRDLLLIRSTTLAGWVGFL